MSLEKEFVLYPEALELKQLGFDKPCFGRFDGRGKNKGKIWYEMPNTGQDSIPVGDVLAPTYSQSFRWFRDKGYRFNMVNDSENINGYYYYDVWHNGQFMFESHYIYPTYEDTELACLRKLIEIVKNK